MPVTATEPLVAELLDALIADDPVLATSLGLPDGLDALPSFSPAAVAARVALARRGIERLAPLAAGAARTLRDASAPDAEHPAPDAPSPVPGAPPDANVTDAAVFLPVLRRVLRLYELRRVHRFLPGHYLRCAQEALLPIMLRDIAPRAERLRALEGRLRALPGFLEEARDNLEPGTPAVFVESGADFAGELLDLTGPTARAFAHGLGRPGALDAAAGAACDALRDFRRHLRERLLPASVPACGAGRAVLEDILRHEHMLDDTPEELAAYGRSVITETKLEMEQLAAGLGHESAAAALAAVRAAHPDLDGLVPAYRRAVEAARDFVVLHRLATLADGEQLEVVATPRALRGVLPFAAYDPPGPFAGRQLGYYFVTPPPADRGSRALAAGLASHPFAAMAVTGVHEAYPGHHVQLTRANTAPRLARRLAGAYGGGTLLVEGWAFYCEEMMERQGFLAGPEARLVRLNDQVWRACRVVIDVEVATGRMSVAEAVDLLVREARMDRRLAEAEVRWYVESPGEPLSYLVGKREIVALGYRFARRRTAALRAFHDAILDWGSVPPRLIAWGLGLAGPPPAVVGA